MNEAETPVRIVRYGELRPCRTAFIDAHTPGSDRKENFTILGAGVSESPDQHVHIRDTPGFNIGAAGQPPHCRNSLHVHRTAEVFFVHKGRWRFFWGLRGTAGEVILEEGDLIDIPTGIFRGFENVGTDYGIIMSVLGGDDAGGGVIWAPQVIEEARAHGLVLSEQGRLYDTKKGESLPPGVGPMPPLTPDALQAYPELPPAAIVPRFVARYLDMISRALHEPAAVIAARDALIADRPGFAIDLLARHSLPAAMRRTRAYEVLLVHRGHWRLAFGDEAALLAPGDTCTIRAGTEIALAPTMAGEAAIFRVTPTDDPAGPTRI
jgi:mannose-6-phosphate isomerase-like protein (cupin superfamily)